MKAFILTITALCWSAAQAAAPMVKTQAPGFYRMMLSEFEITALNDAVVPFSAVKLLGGITAEEVHDRLAEMYLTDPFDMSFNAFLVNTGNNLALIDTGSGTLWGPRAGHVLANLRAAGYGPEQVDEIYITHAHPDHVGGLMLGNERAFPNATLRMAKSEVDPYLDPEKIAAVAVAPNKDQVKALFQSARNSLEPYVKAGKFQSFDQDITLAPGVRAVAIHGHTLGHTAYVVESGKQTLIVFGDLVHVGAVQFATPKAYSIVSDTNPSAAIAQRARIFDLAAVQGYWIAGAHLAFPGIGHIRTEQGRYSWIAANYAIPR